MSEAIYERKFYDEDSWEPLTRTEAEELAGKWYKEPAGFLDAITHHMKKHPHESLRFGPGSEIRLKK